jgi:hypothetical protein
MPERYLNDRRILKLTAEEFRAYVMTTIWCVSNRTDGYVLDEDLDVMSWMGKVKPAVFVQRDLWARTDEGWRLLDFLSMQTSRAEFEKLEDIRKAEREKKRRQRANIKALDGATRTPTWSSPGDNPGDVPGLVPEDSRGKAGRDNEVNYDKTTGEVDEQLGQVSLPAASPLAREAMTAWSSSKTCRVCSKVIPAASPIDVCGTQDDEHNFARSNRSSAA